MVCSNRLGVASIYSGERGPTGRTVSSSWSMVQTAIGMGDGRGGAVLPGDAQRHGGETWGGAVWSERDGALRVPDGEFNGAQRAWSARRRTSVSAGLLGRW